jgi:Acetyltransferase (GNAT) domain
VNASQEDVTNLFPRALTETFHRQGLPSPYPDCVGAELWDRLHNDKNVLMRTVHVGDVPTGVVIAPMTQRTTFTWMGVSLESGRASNVNSVMYHDLMVRSMERGRDGLDLVATASDNMSRFKGEFGTTVRPFLMSSHIASARYTFARGAAFRGRAVAQRFTSSRSRKTVEPNRGSRPCPD